MPNIQNLATFALLVEISRFNGHLRRWPTKWLDTPKSSKVAMYFEMATLITVGHLGAATIPSRHRRLSS